jgi:hypothetical protein
LTARRKIEAARFSGVQRMTVLNRVKKYGIELNRAIEKNRGWYDCIAPVISLTAIYILTIQLYLRYVHIPIINISVDRHNCTLTFGIQYIWSNINGDLKPKALPWLLKKN